VLLLVARRDRRPLRMQQLLRAQGIGWDACHSD
jgi:hypothetical protein